MTRFLTAALAVFIASTSAHAKVKTEHVEYKDGETVLEGFVAYDDATKAKRPGIVVVHDWMGPTKSSEDKAKELAALGYYAFAADIYGKGVRPANAQEAGAQAGKYKSDRATLRSRVRAAFDTMLKSALVDAKKTGAIGFCFGGTTALELARSGAPVDVIVSFHGGLETPTPADAKNIKARIVALHGADDPYVKPEEVAGFEKEMTAAKVDWSVVKYSGAVHAFMIPDAGNDPSKGAAYNAVVAKRAWREMKSTFDEVFGAR